MDDETRQALGQLRSELHEIRAELVTGLTEIRGTLGTINGNLASMAVTMVQHLEDHRRGIA
jgi:hypothetical protein